MKNIIWIEIRQTKLILIRQTLIQMLKKISEFKMFKIIPKNSYWFILDINHAQFKDLKSYIEKRKINLVLWNNQKKKVFMYFQKIFKKPLQKKNYQKIGRNFNFIDSELSFIDGYSKYQINENLNLLTLLVDENCFGNFSFFRILFNEIFQNIFFRKKKFRLIFLAFKKIYEPYSEGRGILGLTYFFFFFLFSRINYGF
ncbi:hypothetical protein HAN_2g251 (nucleomorph) [Hemiselmis andersenii]|uniref:Uncharacterized protein n=1 Tax=Hemiselmis andersenii TaxID=464988 RepID=A9BKS1_HEMAN|nr:hypothetical protein HAN_2g251 [Hemiselmis andersenii]ABW98076.1 hypothetical protein HAN_2g251 [Hemiselmis andersenii]